MTQPEKNFGGFSTAQWRLFGVVLVVGLSGIFFHLLARQELNNSAALYVGLPFLFALGLSLTPKTSSSMGATMKGLTIALLLSAPVFMEGFICILFAAPIFYSVAALFAWAADRAKKRQDAKSKIQLSVFTVLLAFGSLEGTQEALTVARFNQVSYERIVDMSPAAIRDNLTQVAMFSGERPLLLKIFPMPKNIAGMGLAIGDERRVDFVYKKWIFANVHQGSTVFRVVKSEPNYIAFDIPQDDSYLSHYLHWRASEVFLEPTASGKTKITWQLSYDRKLDPAWYFGPLQHYAAELTAKVLVDHATAPAP